MNDQPGKFTTFNSGFPEAISSPQFLLESFQRYDYVFTNSAFQFEVINYHLREFENVITFAYDQR